MSGYQPKFTLTDVTLLVLFTADKLWKPTLSKKQKEELFNALFRKIEGIHGDSKIASVFPFVGSSDPVISNHDFFGGTLFPLFREQCALAMDPVVSSLEQNPSHSQSPMAQEAVAAGFFDGDGCLNTLSSGEDKPMLYYAIKDSKRHMDYGDDPNAFKHFLNERFAGITEDVDKSTERVRRQLNEETLCGSLFFIAATFCLTIKLPQFIALCNLAVVLRLIFPSRPPFVKFCRRMFARLCSGLNTAHGVGLGRSFYDRRFDMMAKSPIKGLLHYHGAGMLGSDGGILFSRVEIYQSNREYLESFRDICQGELGFHDLVVEPRTQEDKSVNTQGSWLLRFNDDDGARAAFYFGAFDYNRRTQWLLYVISRIITNTDLPKKESVTDFLKEFLSYVKKRRPS